VVKNGKVIIKDVTPGHDFGEEIEIVAGLNADDQVITNPADSLVTGQEVKLSRPPYRGIRDEVVT